MYKRANLVIIMSVIIATIGFIADITVMTHTNQGKPIHTWTKQDSKAYAKDGVNAWAQKQYVCLSSLWGKESAWKQDAINREKVMGKFAGGIPQLLGMSPTTPPTMQIDRGLDYIYHRYTTPCKAWEFHKKHGWY